MQTIAVISDPQLDLGDERAAALLRTCLKNVDADAVAVCGDITENARTEEWDLFFDAFRGNCRAKALFSVPGNMDDAESPAGRGAYLDAHERHFDTRPKALWFSHESDSCILFGIATERENDERPLTDPQLDALDEAVRRAAARDVPALVFSHYPLNDTIDVDWKHAFLGPQSRVVRTIFEKYGGKIVLFSGHIHRGLMKIPGGTLAKMDGVAYVSTPSICHPDRIHYRADDANEGTGLLVELSEGAVRISGRNFFRGERLTDFDWTI